MKFSKLRAVVNGLLVGLLGTSCSIKSGRTVRILGFRCSGTCSYSVYLGQTECTPRFPVGAASNSTDSASKMQLPAKWMVSNSCTQLITLFQRGWLVSYLLGYPALVACIGTPRRRNSQVDPDTNERGFVS